MKKINILFLLLICLFFVNISFSQTIWQRVNPSFSLYDLYDVFFVDDQQGWAVGDNGLVIKTIDAGVSWQEQNYFSTNKHTGVFFVDESNGWIIGYYSNVYKTTNGGDDWKRVVIDSNSFSYSYSIFFIDENTGWLGNNNGGIYKTTDGGQVWNFQNSNSTTRIKKIFFIDEDLGWAITSKTELLKTTNGGLDWVKTEFVEQGNYFNDICFINDMEGWIGASTNYVLKTEDGGEDWDTLLININGYIKKVQLFDNNNGKVLTEENCLVTTDGGLNWTIFPFPDFVDINGVNFIDENIGYVVCDDGEVFNTYDGGYNWEKYYPGTIETLNSICVANENNVYAVGENGTIAFSNDSGESWIEQNSNTTEDLKDVYFIDENTGWAVGNSGTVLFTNNGGTDWLTNDINTNANINAITFINSETGWIIGNYGNIFKTIDSGENWLEQSSGTSNNLNDVEFVDTENGWIVGGNGFILNTHNGGTNWIIQNTIGDRSLYSVSFVDENKGWIAGRNFIINTINGGEEWTIQDSLHTYLSSIMFTDDLNGWACGKEDALHTTNGGLNWVEQNTGVQNELNSLAFFDSQNGYIVGKDGTILSTNMGTHLAPQILNQPGNTVVCIGGEISFELDVVGDALNFQWFNSGDSIIGATTNPLYINPITVSDAGLYKCNIFNEGGSIISNVFSFIVLTPPEITGQPEDITANMNTYIAFNLAVTGTLPFSYQWQKNEVDIPNSNFHIFPIESVQLSDTGYYRCKIYNDCDTVFTDEAKLIVIDNTGIDELDINQSINVFPNPASKEIFIKFKKAFWNQIVQISIFDIMGNNIYQTKYYSNSKNNVLKINCSNFHEGIYFLKVQDEKLSVMKKIILK